MATKRRIGISIASTEAARRQLMQPVTCWEKVWVPPENGAPGSSLKIYKWVKSEKTQQFSDDEGEVDEPLAPLPDEPEVIDGDEEDEALPENAPEETQAMEIVDTAQDEESKPPSPKPQLSMTLQDGPELEGDTLDASLKPMDEDMSVGLGLGNQSISGDGMELNMSGLGPDGLGLESSHNLSQLGGVDGLVGGQVMDDSTDPFAHRAGQEHLGFEAVHFQWSRIPSVFVYPEHMNHELAVISARCLNKVVFERLQMK
ncbi:hypothetical protein C0995_004259 [Termitomyces sp. Mi166|nr:hypothetical protein C0995_004259 [Termitomyces sp. Mi166\